MNTQPRTLKWSVIIGITVVLNLFFNYALSLMYKAPDYLVYCPNPQVNQVVNTQTQCVAQGGQWNGYAADMGPKIAPQPAGYCDLQFICRQNYGATSNAYDRNVFVILVVLGAFALFIGNFLKSNYVISQGLAFGGVLSFIIASMRYWGQANDFIHVVILLVALALLFWIAYKKFKN